jgi:hypothetical protein
MGNNDAGQHETVGGDSAHLLRNLREVTMGERSLLGWCLIISDLGGGPVGFGR